MLELVPIKYNEAPDCAQIKRLYHSAFPKEEQMPWWLIRLLAVQRGVDITGFYENREFCGFTFSVSTDDILFLMFFAVDASKRGKGYGSAILELLKKSNPEKEVFLNVELLDENTENYSDRVRRVTFYKKNGFFDTGYEIDEVGGTFLVLATIPEIDPMKYRKVFEKISLGLWKPRIEKMK